MPPKPGSHRARTPQWAGLPDAELLGWRFRDLRLQLGDTALASDIEYLYKNLASRGLRFRPHVWLSTDWFSPDGIPGIAIPFFAAHPRLAGLERRMHGVAEGSRRAWRRQLLRHEAGHAIDTAYGLRRRSDWRAVFGHASLPYTGQYSVRPTSRRHVLHLADWYAQSHPTEDFAETFAVWLQPRARWQRDYRDWPAMRKLEFVDSLMSEIAGKRPKNSDRSTIAALADNRRSLREHYRRNPVIQTRSERRYDPQLRRVFAAAESRPLATSAARVLREIEPDLRRLTRRRTGADDYLFTHVATGLRRRARELGLVQRSDRKRTRELATRLHQRVVADILERNQESYQL